MISPLAGITVLDLSRALAGPYCTGLLADMGARIIKVESINGGDAARQWPPFEGDHSLYFDSVNANKSSICLDFYSPEGRQILETLVTTADVLVENFKFGTLGKLGLTPERLAELNPALIVASVNGFGRTGPLRDDAGLDQVVQGMSGLMSITGSDVDHTFRVGVPIVDITAGMICAFGIASALVGRAAGDPVTQVSTSLLETALNLAVFQGQKALSLHETPTPQGNNHPTIAPYGTFRTATDPINIAVGTDKQWRAFCDLLHTPHAAADARFATGALRSVNRDALTTVIEAALASTGAADWIARISAAGIPCGAIYDLTQALESEQVAALGLIQQSRRRDGSELPLLRGPLSVNGEPSEVKSPPPLLGEQTADILHEIGLSTLDIDRLEAAGIVTTGRARSVAAR